MRNREKPTLRGGMMRRDYAEVDIIGVLTFAEKFCSLGTLGQRVQEIVLKTALELDVTPGKLDKPVGRRTIAQILLEDLIGAHMPMPESGWKEPPPICLDPLYCGQGFDLCGACADTLREA